MEYFIKNIQKPASEDNWFVVKYEIGDSTIDVHFFNEFEAHIQYKNLREAMDSESQKYPLLNTINAKHKCLKNKDLSDKNV